MTRMHFSGIIRTTLERDVF